MEWLCWWQHTQTDETRTIPFVTHRRKTSRFIEHLLHAGHHTRDHTHSFNPPGSPICKRGALFLFCKRVLSELGSEPSP